MHGSSCSLRGCEHYSHQSAPTDSNVARALGREANAFRLATAEVAAQPTVPTELCPPPRACLPDILLALLLLFLLCSFVSLLCSSTIFPLFDSVCSLLSLLLIILLLFVFTSRKNKQTKQTKTQYKKQGGPQRAQLKEGARKPVSVGEHFADRTGAGGE